MRTFIMRAVTTVAAALIAGTAIVSAGATPALAHDELTNTEIVTDTASGSPSGIRLTFNNSILEVGTEFVITTPDGSDASDGAVEVSGTDVTLPLAEGLIAGDYQVAWRVVSSDGHPIEGSFIVEVAADGSARVLDAAEAPAEAASTEVGEEDVENEETANGSSALRIALFSVGAVAVVGALAAIIIGQRRRAQAIAEAGEAASADNTEDNTESGR